MQLKQNTKSGKNAIKKKCTLCEKDRFKNIKYCYSCWRKETKRKAEEKKTKKLEKKKTTKKWIKKVTDKLIKDIDRLFQIYIVGKNKECCYCGNVCQVAHHFITKKRSLFLRYEEMNAVPLCNRCHCLIHQSQESTITFISGNFLIKTFGSDTIYYLERNKGHIVLNRDEFVFEQNERLKKLTN